MAVCELLRELNIPAETATAVSAISLPENHSSLKELFFNDPKTFRKSASSLDGLEILRLYLEWALDTKALYDKIGIPESFFWDSMRDIPIWCDDYLQKHGVPGFAEWDWVGRSFRLEVIRIGRLQFEPASLEHALTVSGKMLPAGTPVLHVHVPAGEPLDIGEVMASIDQAPAFFRKYFNREFSLLHCHSWLLSPDLKNLLAERSRIIQFQNLFTVYGTDDERQAEERVFGFLADDPQAYPETTSLQKAVKTYMLDGRTVKMAAGIRFI